MAWRRPGRQVAVACRILRQRGPFLRGDGEAYHLGGRRVSAAAGPGGVGPVALELTAVERLRQGHVWLRYDVRDGPAG
jgi:hypothetical protein